MSKNDIIKTKYLFYNVVQMCIDRMFKFGNVVSHSFLRKLRFAKYKIWQFSWQSVGGNRIIENVQMNLFFFEVENFFYYQWTATDSHSEYRATWQPFLFCIYRAKTETFDDKSISNIIWSLVLTRKTTKTYCLYLKFVHPL